MICSESSTHHFLFEVSNDIANEREKKKETNSGHTFRNVMCHVMSSDYYMNSFSCTHKI